MKRSQSTRNEVCPARRRNQLATSTESQKHCQWPREAACKAHEIGCNEAGSGGPQSSNCDNLTVQRAQFERKTNAAGFFFLGGHDAHGVRDGK